MDLNFSAFCDELTKMASTFAVPASKSNTGEKAYPIPDKQHARSALGFAKMHGDKADFAAVVEKVREKYPEMLQKKGAKMPGFLQRMTSGPLEHKTELAGLGLLGALPADQIQAHLRSRKGEDWQKKSLLGGEIGHGVGDIAGLGMLAAPSIAHLRHS